MLDRLKYWARAIKRDVHAIYLAAGDARTPWYARALAFCVAGYALSPIDLIPDFIPVLGYLDDAIIVPLILAVVKMIPPEVMAEHRAAAALAGRRPTSRTAAVVIACAWAASSADGMARVSLSPQLNFNLTSAGSSPICGGRSMGRSAHVMGEQAEVQYSRLRPPGREGMATQGVELLQACTLRTVSCIHHTN